VTRNHSRKRLTIERFVADCLDVRDLRRRGFFDGGWVTIGSTLRWPLIVKTERKGSPTMTLKHLEASK
jgi:hypothetical protein